MEERERKNQLQCIVDEGILVNRRDMVRILRDLGHVRYLDMHGEAVRAEGEGYVVSVQASSHASTIIVNKRLYLNVNSFEYIRLGTGESGAQIDLVDEGRVLRLIPLGDPLSDRQALVPAETLLPQRGALDKLFGFADGATGFAESPSGEPFAEVFLEDDFEEEDD